MNLAPRSSVFQCFTSILFAAALCGSALADEYTVGMKNWEFQPKVLTIKIGDTVVWVNDDDSHHKIIFENGSVKELDNIKPGRQLSMTFDEAGEYHYFCKYHSDYGMKGTIIVEGSVNYSKLLSKPKYILY